MRNDDKFSSIYDSKISINKNSMKKILLLTIGFCMFNVFNTLQAQHLDGIMSDGKSVGEGELAVGGSVDIDNEGLFIRGRYGLSVGDLFGGLGLYDEGVGTHIFLGLERNHRSFEVSESTTLNGFYQFGFAFRQTDLSDVEVTSTTLRASYLVRNQFSERFSAYSGLTGAFVIQSIETSLVGNSASSSDNDIQFTLPIGASYNLDNAAKLRLFGELGLGFSSGAGYLHAGIRYSL